MTDSPKQRVLEIRKALGNGTYPLSQAKVAALLTAVSGRKYDGSMVAKMETGIRGVSAHDARWLAEIDPHRRGMAWVLCLPPEALLGEATTPPVQEGGPVQSYNQEEDAKQAAKVRAELARREQQKAGGGE